MNKLDCTMNIEIGDKMVINADGNVNIVLSKNEDGYKIETIVCGKSIAIDVSNEEIENHNANRFDCIDADELERELDRILTDDDEFPLI